MKICVLVHANTAKYFNLPVWCLQISLFFGLFGWFAFWGFFLGGYVCLVFGFLFVYWGFLHAKIM